jgi:elongation factor G
MNNTRVIGIYAHIDAGKTTTSEAILYYTGRIHRIGSVDDGSTQLDWMEQERARGITITAAASTCFWRSCRINLIDTPGHIDFTAEVMRSIRVIDGAVVVLCGVGGVETQTETVWRYATEASQRDHPLPRLIFINKLDRDSADFDFVLEEIRERLTLSAVALQIPLDQGDAFHGIIDLLEQQALVWSSAGNGQATEPTALPIPEGMVERSVALRSRLVDAICETDETLFSQRIEGREPQTAVLRAALRRATLSGQLVPVLCGSAKRRIGLQPLLDAIVDYLPAPDDRPEVGGTDISGAVQLTRGAGPDAPFCATAFKIVTDPHVGHLTWVRVFSGCLNVGDWVLNPRTGEQERVGRIYQIHANRREHVGRAQAGDVVALVGVKATITGDSLCHPQHPILLEPFHFPEPVISVALAPPTDEERDRLHFSVARLCDEDPTLRLNFDAETGEQILSGMGELHLEIAVDRLRSEYGITARVSPFQIAYRETIQHKAEATGAYRKQSGGHGHFAQVRMRVEPLKRSEGILFLNRANPVELPEGYARAAEAGAREALARGILAGYPVTDLRVMILGGRYHEIDSNSLDFRIAGSMAIRQALQQAGPLLLEPVMLADIRVGEDYLHSVLADFLRRRGHVDDLLINGKMRTLRGEAPLAEARGYASALRNMTQGRGTFTLEFRRYEVVPEQIAEEIIKERLEGGKVNVR